MLDTDRREANEGAEGLDAAELPNPKKDVGVMRRAYTADKKSLLRELNINVNKGDGPAAYSLFEKLKVTVNRRGKVNGAEYDGTKIIVQRGKRLVFTEDVKKVSKVNEFNSLVRRAEAEHKNTAVALVEEKLDVTNDELTDSVLRSSIERLDEEISERADEIAVELSENELRELRGILATRVPTAEQQREGLITVEQRIKSIKTEETHWKTEAERQSNQNKRNFFTRQ